MRNNKQSSIVVAPDCNSGVTNPNNHRRLKVVREWGMEVLRRTITKAARRQHGLRLDLPDPVRAIPLSNSKPRENIPHKIPIRRVELHYVSSRNLVLITIKIKQLKLLTVTLKS